MSDRFQQAISAIDDRNSDDPIKVVYQGEEYLKERLHSELMTKWVKELNPSADEVQLLAARACHLRRWEIPRKEYPAGRPGYLHWRRDQAKRHSQLASEILMDAGYEVEAAREVEEIIQKKNLKGNPKVQTHEDALCLVFLELQFEELKGRLIEEDGEQGNKKMEEIMQKTLKKMSPKAQKIAQEYTDD